VHLFGDLLVFLADTEQAARTRQSQLDELAGEQYRSDAHTFVGTATQLADLLQEWHAAGLSGFRLRPAALPHDLVQITEALVPELRRRRMFRDRYAAGTLRGLLGLPRPANRYATA
jgi:alkanesulfonate monooxygenase SsuD/methylene tetrahydromethanopterin reductase-like flavin-dependent oxidoreductase (luciferase family)